MKRQQRLVAILAIGYALIFVVWRVLVATPRFSSWWPFQISEIFGVWALLPLPFLVAAALLWRARWAWLALLVPMIWFGHEYAGLYVPSAFSVARASTNQSTLRVMTFNTMYLYGQNQQFMDTVREWQPDIFALQEANPVFVKRIGSDAEKWPYQEYTPVRTTGRVAIFSKWPILSIKSDNDWTGCHCAQALVDWHGESIRVIVLHIRSPSFGPRIRGKLPAINMFDDSQQAFSYDALVSIIEASPEPVIVLGDFNTTERQLGYHRIYEAGLKDAHEEAGWGLGLTYPAPFTRVRWLPFSLIRIDHIFYDSSWRAAWTRTMPLTASDHQAIFGELQWTGQEYSSEDSKKIP